MHDITTLQLTVTHSPIELGRPVPQPIQGDGIVRGVALGLVLWLALGVLALAVRAVAGWLQ